MNVFLYLDRESPVHRLDPRTKLFLLGLFFSLALVFNHPAYVAAVSLLVTLGIFLSGAQTTVWRFRFLLILLFFFSGLIWSLTLKGFPVWFSWGPFQVSRESVAYGLAMGLRLATFVGAGLLFLSTTRNEEITQGLIRLKVPYPVAFAVATALRLIPTLAGAGATIIQAQVSRGLDLGKGNILRRLSHFIPQAVPLLLVALRQTNSLAMSLEARGFDPATPRTWYYELKMTRRDYLVVAAGIGLLLGGGYLRFGLNLGAVLVHHL
ncbi:MAG: energy-coupling factor transporter transmembrane protein EcfT [Deltaproteobacteria bacterium]|nr:energy-coupling factor transporter transmembrane protein EcfT [Deltaproteobacteria bacterium]